MKKKFIIGVILVLILLSGCGITVSPDEKKLCTDLETGNSMTMSEASEIVIAGPCYEEGELEKVGTDRYWCNENTGTWWFDMDIEIEGCNPACVVDVNTGESEVNWMCTGLNE